MLLYLSILSRLQVAESKQSCWTLMSMATIQPTLPTYWLGQKDECRKPSPGLIAGPIIHNQIRAWVIFAGNSVGACPCPHLSQVQPAAFTVAWDSCTKYVPCRSHVSNFHLCFLKYLCSSFFPDTGLFSRFHVSSPIQGGLLLLPHFCGGAP